MYKLGSELEVDKGLFKHKASYVGHGHVVHNHPDTGEEIAKIEKFSKGRKIVLVKNGVEDINGFFERVHEVMASPKAYNPFSNNCEHTVSKVRTGKAVSPQLVGWGATIIGASALYLLLKSKK